MAVPTLKIILKVKDELELIEKWIEHHASIVGFENLVILDCGSTDEKFLSILDRYRLQAHISEYAGYYDHIHQYGINRDFYDRLAEQSKYITVLDADEFLFGRRGDAIHPSYALDFLQGSSLPCVCGTWFHNTNAPATSRDAFDWTQSISFGLDEQTVKWGSRQGKSIVRSNCISQTKYIGHNVGDRRLEKLISAESFGHIGIFHLTTLGANVAKRRSLQHLAAKGIAPKDVSQAELEVALKSYAVSDKAKPIEKLYISRFFNSSQEAVHPQHTILTNLLAGGLPEQHEGLRVWSAFNFTELLNDVREQQAALQKPVMLYEDEEIVVFWRNGMSDYALITFGDLVSLALDTRFSADAVVSKLDLNCIGFMAKRPNWYPRKNVEAALPVVLRRLAPFRDRVLYGGSMGGHAALKFSAALHATTVIAYCPQWSIDQEECGNVNPGWQDYYDSSMQGMGIKSKDMAGRAFVFSDPLNPSDTFHTDMIKATSPQVSRQSMTFVSHHVTAALAGTQVLADIIAACRSEDTLAIAALSRRARRQGPPYLENVLKRAGERFPGRVLEYLKTRDLTKLSDPESSALLVFTSALIKKGRLIEAANCIEIAKSLEKLPCKQAALAAACASLNGTRSRISTSHQTALAYSVPLSRCVHVNPASPLLGNLLLPIKSHLLEDSVTLSVDMHELGHADLGLDEKGYLILAQQTPRAFFHAICLAPGRFVLRHGADFVCAEPQGELVCNRKTAGKWESLCFT